VSRRASVARRQRRDSGPWHIDLQVSRRLSRRFLDQPNRFGILSLVFGIFRHCKYQCRYQYRYFKISSISSVFQHTDPGLFQIAWDCISITTFGHVTL